MAIEARPGLPLRHTGLEPATAVPSWCRRAVQSGLSGVAQAESRAGGRDAARSGERGEERPWDQGTGRGYEDGRTEERGED